MNQQLLIIESVCMCLASCDDLATHPGCTTLPTKPLICMCIVSLVYPVIFILLEHNRLHRSFHFLSLSQPCIFKCRERWPWSFYCTENLLHILQGIQSTGEFINTDLEPCLPSSIRVTCQWQRIFFSSPSGLPLLSPCLLHEVSDFSSSVRQQYPAL